VDRNGLGPEVLAICIAQPWICLATATIIVGTGATAAIYLATKEGRDVPEISLPDIPDTVKDVVKTTANIGRGLLRALSSRVEYTADQQSMLESAQCSRMPSGSCNTNSSVQTPVETPVAPVSNDFTNSRALADACNGGFCAGDVQTAVATATPSWWLQTPIPAPTAPWYNPTAEIAGQISEYRLSGFDKKVGTLAEHLAKILGRDVADYGPSPNPNPYRDPDRGWCTTIKNKITELRNARYSEAQLSRDLNNAGFGGGRWTEITGAIAEVVARGLCDDHWPDDFDAGGPLATA
jgi:hypothetical protein